MSPGAAAVAAQRRRRGGIGKAMEPLVARNGQAGSSRQDSNGTGIVMDNYGATDETTTFANEDYMVRN